MLNPKPIRYYPQRILVTNKNRPVVLNTQLPAHVCRITGVRVVHSVGLNLFNGMPQRLPSIGWIYLEVNNRKDVIGNISVGYDSGIDGSNEYLELDIPVQRGALLTGIYNNTFDDYPDNLNYVVTIYLRYEKI
jgi:hypothetical protein